MVDKKISYCDWKYILIAILFYCLISFEYWLSHIYYEAIYDGYSAIVSITYMIILGWIIFQGYKCVDRKCK